MRLSLAIFAASALCVGALQAQTDASALAGSVKDQAGAAIANATVALRGRGAARTFRTNLRGQFYFAALQPGEYELTVEAPGFRTYSDSRVALEVAKTSRVEIEMELGPATDSVEVRASVSALDADSAALGTVITGEKITALPLNGRQFQQLVLLAPLANIGGRGAQQRSVRLGQIGGVSIAGGRTGNTAVLLDGAINIDPDFSSLSYSPNIDSIAEFQVQTAMAGAEYGRATVNVVTRSGANDLHGSAWEFLRNKALDARPFNLAGDLPQFQRNQFGATAGGPIVRKRLFTFLSYEGLRVRQAGGGLTTTTTPGEAQRRGDFSQSRGGIFDPGAARPNPSGGTIRDRFPGDQIPANRMNPLARAAMLALPEPTDPLTNSYVNATGLLAQHNNNSSGRLDWTASRGWNIFGRYSIENDAARLPQSVPGRDNVGNLRSQHLAAGSTYVIASNVVNETRLGYSRSRIANGLPEPNFDVPGLGSTALPQFNVAGYPQMGGAGGYTPGTSGGLALVRDNIYQLYDNIAWTHGRHALKFGASVDWTQYNRIETPNTLGSYQFTDGFTTRTARNDGTGDALATFLLGLPATASRSVGPSRIDGRQWAWALYAQDTFRVAPRLTLNLGLRYEFSAPLSDARRQMASIDFGSVPSPASIFAQGRSAFYKPALFVCGASGYPAGCAYADRNNFAPRIGVAWEASPKTVLRAGAGVFYLNIDDNPLLRLAAGLPDNVSQTVNSDNFVPRFRNLDVFETAAVGTTQVQAAAIDLRQRTGYSMEWTASVERQLGRLAVIEIGYVASLGLKLEQSLQPNSARPGAGQVDARRPYAGLQFAPGTHFPDYVNVTTASVPAGVITYLPHWAQSNYHAGFVRVERRFSGGLTFLNSYTWSKAISNAPQTRNAGSVAGGDNSPPQDSYNLRAERGLAAYHAAQRFVSTVVYDVPFLKGKRGGTQVAAIWSMQTGFPFSLGLRGDTAGIGAGQGAMYMRPNAMAGVRVDLPGSERTTERWLNAAAVSTPPAATFGNVGRNTVIGPGLANLDVAVSRFYAPAERLRMEFRAEFFDALNHPNYNSVGRILNDPTFGRVLSQLDPRQIQFGLKLNF